MKQSIPNYPKMDGHRKIHVRYPVKLTVADLTKFPIALKAGKWVSVNVLPDGFQHLVAPAAYDTFDECQQACRISNQFQGWTVDEANAIVSASMENSVTKEIKPRRKSTMAKV